MEFEELRRVQTAQLNAYYEGLKEGIRMYAWMKDGVTYVGTCGWTLREELDKVDRQRAERLEHLLKESDDRDVSRPHPALSRTP